jgi:hypothetical protein
MTASLREASLWNYPNEGAEPLRDHKAWLDENVVDALRGARTLSCRLVGSASNDRAGVAYNLTVAKRRAETARKYLLGRGVDGRQITEVQGVVDASVRSTSPRDRSVDVFLEQPVNKNFAIRVVPRDDTVPPLEGRPPFFHIRDRSNFVDAFYVLDRPPGAGTLLLPVKTAFDFFSIAGGWAAVQDFNGALMTLRSIGNNFGDDPIQPNLFVTINRPGQFSTLFAMVSVTSSEIEVPNNTSGTLRLVRGPE